MSAVQRLIVNSDRSLVECDRALYELFQEHKYLRVEVVPGKCRSLEQNRLQRLWLQEAGKQGDMSAEEYRGYCKLRLGVPILRRDSEVFREQYDRIIKPLPYEDKLQMMMEPLDFPITRLMSKNQKTEYLDAMYQHLRGLGFQLTEPDQ